MSIGREIQQNSLGVWPRRVRMWIAAAVVFVAVYAYLSSGSIVTWLISKGMIGEGTTGTLPGTIESVSGTVAVAGVVLIVLRTFLRRFTVPVLELIVAAPVTTARVTGRAGSVVYGDLFGYVMFVARVVLAVGRGLAAVGLLIGRPVVGFGAQVASAIGSGAVYIGRYLAQWLGLVFVGMRVVGSTLVAGLVFVVSLLGLVVVGGLVLVSKAGLWVWGVSVSLWAGVLGAVRAVGSAVIGLLSPPVTMFARFVMFLGRVVGGAAVAIDTFVRRVAALLVSGTRWVATVVASWAHRVAALFATGVHWVTTLLATGARWIAAVFVSGARRVGEWIGLSGLYVRRAIGQLAAWVGIGLGVVGGWVIGAYDITLVVLTKIGTPIASIAMWVAGVIQAVPGRVKLAVALMWRGFVGALVRIPRYILLVLVALPAYAYLRWSPVAFRPIRYVYSLVASAAVYVWGLVTGASGRMWRVVVGVSRTIVHWLDVAMIAIGLGIGRLVTFIWWRLVVAGARYVALAVRFVAQGIWMPVAFMARWSWIGLVIGAKALAKGAVVVGVLAVAAVVIVSGVVAGIAVLVAKGLAWVATVIWGGATVIWLQFVRVVVAIWQGIGTGLRWSVQMVGRLFELVWLAVTKTASVVASSAGWLWSRIVRVTRAVVIAGMLASMAVAILVVAVVQFVGAVVTAIAGYVSAVWGGFISILAKVVSAISDALGVGWRVVVLALSAIGNGFAAVGHGVAFVAGKIAATVVAGATAVGDFVSDMWGRANRLTVAIASAVATGVRNFVAAVSTTASKVGLALVAAAVGVARFTDWLWGLVTAVAVAVWGGVERTSVRVWSEVVFASTTSWWAVSSFVWTTGMGINRTGSAGWLVVSTVALSIWFVISWTSARIWLGIVVTSERIWHWIAWVSERVWNAIAALSKTVWWVVSSFVRTTGLGVARTGAGVWLVVSVVGLAIWFVLSRVADAVWFATAWTSTLIWDGVSWISVRTWSAITFVSQKISDGAVAVWRFVGNVARWIWEPTDAGSQATWNWLVGASNAIGRTTRRGGQAVASDMRKIFAWVWRGVATVAQLVVLLLFVVAIGIGKVLMVIGGFVRKALVGVWHPVHAVSVDVYGLLVRFAGWVWRLVGVVSSGLRGELLRLWGYVRWALELAWVPVWLLIRVIVLSPVFVAINIWEAIRVPFDLVDSGGRLTLIATAPFDRWRGDLYLAVRRLGTLALLVGLVGYVWVLAPWEPEPPLYVDHWATGHLFFEDGMELMAERFNAQGRISPAGKVIEVRVHNNPSSLQTEDLLSRMRDGVKMPRECCGPGPDPHLDPTIITPSSAHWIIPLNYELAQVGKPKAIDLSRSDVTRPIALAYIGIVTYKEMAECLGWPEKAIGFADLVELGQDPDGWGAYPCKETAEREWGTRPLVAFTDPKTSSTGRSVLLSLYLNATGKAPEELEMKHIREISNVVGDGVAVAEVQTHIQEFQELIDHYMIGTTVLNTKIHQGPKFGHFFLMPEDNLIHLKEGTARAYVGGKRVTPPRYEPQMVMIYPKEGTLARNNCACLVDADWVSDDERAAANMWIDFLREEQQQRAFMRAGFRAVGDFTIYENDRDDRITAEFGLTPGRPAKELDVSKIDPEVAKEIDDQWEVMKRPGVVTFVVDTSGSMRIGGRLNKAKEGINLGLRRMASNNVVGLVSFDDVARLESEVGQISESTSAGVAHLKELQEAVRKMEGKDETALYDAIKLAVEMTDKGGVAEELVNPIRAVVVLTDGRANRGSTQLDDLITMSAGGWKITSFSGMDEGALPVDENGARVYAEELVGTGLAIETENDVQIFYIGIGSGADLEIGRLLAEATGAEFQGVTEDDLAELLEEFSGYF